MEFRHLFVRGCVFRDPQGLSLAVRPAKFTRSPLSISLSSPAAPSAFPAGPTILLIALSIFLPIASVRTLGCLVLDAVFVLASVVFELLCSSCDGTYKMRE
jgi:hypothetical protein